MTNRLKSIIKHLIDLKKRNNCKTDAAIDVSAFVCFISAIMFSNRKKRKTEKLLYMFVLINEEVIYDDETVYFDLSLLDC